MVFNTPDDAYWSMTSMPSQNNTWCYWILCDSVISLLRALDFYKLCAHHKMYNHNIIT